MDLSCYSKYLDRLHDKTVYLFTEDSTSSGYIGDVPVWKLASSALCSISSITDSVTLEMYGSRCEKMCSLHFSPNTDISNDMGISLTPDVAEPEYKIVSINRRQTHTQVLIEAVQYGNEF